MTARPMNRTEALAEARRRWGAGGFAHHARAIRTFEVGRGWDSVWPKVMGSGPTWEAAFADADKREKEAGR